MFVLATGASTARNLELNHLSLPLLVSSQFKVLAAFQGNLLADFAFTALHPKHNLLCGLSLLNNNTHNEDTKTITTIQKTSLYLFPENRLCLTTITLLFSVVTTTTLGGTALLGLLVLRHFMDFVGLAFFAIRTTALRYVHLNRPEVKQGIQCLMMG